MVDMGAFKSAQNSRAKRQFTLENVFNNAFLLTTISIGMMAWIIAFVSCILANLRDKFPNFAWWAIVYMFFVIIGVFIAVGTDSQKKYQISIVGFVSTGLVLTTSAVNSLVYQSAAPQEAASAGFILLSMVAVVWIFHFGIREPEPAAPAVHTRPVSPASPSQKLPFLTKALYSYQANVADDTEVSFVANDNILVFDRSSRWWTVMVPGGQLGIAPGNYLSTEYTDEK